MRDRRLTCGDGLGPTNRAEGDNRLVDGVIRHHDDESAEPHLPRSGECLGAGREVVHWPLPRDPVADEFTASNADRPAEIFGHHGPQPCRAEHDMIDLAARCPCRDVVPHREPDAECAERSRRVLFGESVSEGPTDGLRGIPNQASIVRVVEFYAPTRPFPNLLEVSLAPPTAGVTVRSCSRSRVRSRGRRSGCEAAVTGRLRPTGVIGRACLHGTHSLPCQLHRSEPLRVSPGVGVSLSECPPKSALEFLRCGGCRNPENLVRAHVERAFGHRLRIARPAWVILSGRT